MPNDILRKDALMLRKVGKCLAFSPERYMPNSVFDRFLDYGFAPYHLPDSRSYRSSVTSTLTRAWWPSATGYVTDTEPPHGRGGRLVGNAHTYNWDPFSAQSRGWLTVAASHPVDDYFLPTFSLLLHPMALQWLAQTERVFS